MKQKFNTIFLLIIAQTIAANFLFGQSAPPGIPYQAIARNANGTPYVNANLTVRFSLHEQTATGTVSYAETKSLQTNDLGLFSTTFGSGTPVTGTFASINWAQTSKFLQVEINLGSVWVDMGTQQLMSVPYALFSAVSNSSNQLAFSNFQVFSIPGSYNWTVPSGVSKVIVECWGAGSGGAYYTGSCAGSAGGYGKSIIDVTGLSSISVIVGAGSSPGANAHIEGGSSSFGNILLSTGASAGGCGGSIPGSSNGNVIALSGGAGVGNNGGNAPVGGFGGTGASVSTANGGTPGAGGANVYVAPWNYLNGKGGDGKVIVFW
jgi:hypothetical protein